MRLCIIPTGGVVTDVDRPFLTKAAGEALSKPLKATASWSGLVGTALDRRHASPHSSKLGRSISTTLLVATAKLRHQGVDMFTHRLDEHNEVEADEYVDHDDSVDDDN